MPVYGRAEKVPSERTQHAAAPPLSGAAITAQRDRSYDPGSNTFAAKDARRYPASRRSRCGATVPVSAACGVSTAVAG